MVASFSAQQVGAAAPASTDPAPQLFRRRDEGFTLVEVIWALMLIGVIAMGSLALFLHSMKTIAHLQRQQAAVSLASSAMDAARSVAGGAVNATGTSGLIKGRSETAVQTVWDEATAAEATDTADMTIAWDPEGGLTQADQWVPVRTAAVVADQPFTIDTLVGTCFRLRAASLVSQNCVATNPALDDSYVEIYRVRVVVRWDEGEAASGAHTYRVSSLVDPSEDATWNTAVKPFAYDDEFSVSVGAEPTFHAVVLNDSVDYDPSEGSPIVNLTQPPSGRGDVDVSESNGVEFTPPADTTKSGTVTFQYKVQGTSGEISAEFATVTVHIVPTPAADSFTVESGVSHDITDELLVGDLGLDNFDSDRTTTVLPVWDRSVDMFSVEDVTPAIQDARAQDLQNLANAGITVDGDGRVHFAAPDTDGAVTSFFYYLVDDPASGDGLRFPSAEAVQVTITTHEVVLEVSDQVYAVDGATNAQFYNNIPWRTLTGNLVGNKIRVESITGPDAHDDQVRLDGAVGLGTGEQLDFQTVAGTAGTYELTYRVVSPAGRVSATTATLVIEVVPVGADVTIPASTSTVTDASPQTFAVVPPDSGWATINDVGLTDVEIVSTATCDNLQRPDDEPLQVRVTFTGTNESCIMRFWVVTTGPESTPTTSAGWYTLTVNRK